MNSTDGLTIWLTGLPSAGKSTIANIIEQDLRARGLPVEVLDGDVVRTNLSKGLGFSREDRDINIRRIAFVSNLLTRNGVVVIVAAVSPYRRTRDEARDLIGRFFEVYVKCPIDVLVDRDVKGLYAQALRGEISNFTGVSDPYEDPENPEVTVETNLQSPKESAAKIMSELERRRFIPTTSHARSGVAGDDR